MERYTYPQFPQKVSAVHVALLKDVQNAAALRARLIKAASMTGPEGDAEREAVNFAFIDARLICSPIHLRTAIYQAILALIQGGLRTKSVHSEIIWTLNPTNNITEALRRYGVNEDSRSLFVVRVSGPEEGFEDRVPSVVQGRLVPLNALSDITDWSAIKKYYKLNGEPSLRSIAKDPQAEHAKIDSIVTSSVATKMVMG